MADEATRLEMARTARREAAPITPALLLGMGLGGFVDGIVLHQILQWHHMLTATGDHPANTVQGLQDNTFADGVFHAAVWLLVALGGTLVVHAWKHGRLAPPWRVHVGLIFAGWGAFNVVEGLINHHLLTLHHVRDDVAEPTGWDLGFLLLSTLLLAIGTLLSRPAWRDRSR